MARWLTPDEATPDLERPLAWLARDDDPAWEALTAGVRPSALDLSDAALFASPSRSAARLRRRLLLKALAGRILGAEVNEVMIERTPAGAISVTAPTRLCASLSARDGWTMVGLATTAIGVDIETARLAEPLPLDVLSSAEFDKLATMPERERVAAFARYWVVKEAALKANGTGLNLNPAKLHVRFDLGRAEVFDDQHRRFARAEVRSAGPGFAALARRGDLN